MVAFEGFCNENGAAAGKKGRPAIAVADVLRKERRGISPGRLSDVIVILF
jgi:hypothetical protein